MSFLSMQGTYPKRLQKKGSRQTRERKCNWLSKIRLIWPTIKKISNELDSVLDKRSEVSKDELGTLKGAKAQFFVEPGAVPKFHKLRPVPHAIKGAIEQELDRLENMGVLEKIRFSN